MKSNKKVFKTFTMLTIVSVAFLGSMVIDAKRGRRGSHHHRRRSHGRVGLGLGIGGGGFSLGIGSGGFGFNTGYSRYWDRPYWSGWRGSYWGPSQPWLDYRSYWVDQDYKWPKITNNTGEAIKFYVSEREGSQYTLTVVTKSGETRTFKGLELPEMKRVEVIIDNSGQLQVIPQ